MKSLLIFSLLIASLCRAELYTDTGTGISFPDKCDDWQRVDVNVFPDAESGISISYKSEKGVITLYVYTLGISEIPSGGGSDIISYHIQQVGDAVAKSWTEQGAVVSEALPVSQVCSISGGPVKAMVVVHKLVMNGQTIYSYTGLTGYKSRFFKLRYTDMGGSEVDSGLQVIYSFVVELMNTSSNRDTLDPYFIDTLSNQSVETTAPAAPSP